MCRWDLIERSPLWPARPAAGLHPQHRGRQVELVVHDHETFRLDAVAAREQRDGLARLVHVGERDGEREALPSPPGRATLTSSTRARSLPLRSRAP